MRRTSGGVVVALLLGTLALVASPAQGSWWDSLETPKEVSLGKVVENPDAFLGVPIEFTIQFHETTKFYNPFFTRFTPDRYVNFAAWADEAALWMADDFASSYPLFFVDKTTPLARQVLEMPTFTRVKVTALVRSTFKGEAWIEIQKFRVQKDSLTPTALGSIVQGDRFAAQDRHNAAIQHYLQAWNSGELPGPARALVAARLGKSYLETAKPVEAQDFLGEAVKLNPKDEESKILLNRAIARSAGAPAGGPTEGGESPVPEEETDDGRFDTPEVEPIPAPEGEEPKPAEDEEGGSPDKRLSPPR